MSRNVLRYLYAAALAQRLSRRGLALTGMGLVLSGPVTVAAQDAPARPTMALLAPAWPIPPSAPAPASPRFLFKGGLQLTHLFYLPDHLGWQLVFPASLGFEYRLSSRFSLLARAEADIAAGRAPRGRRGGNQAPAAGVALGLGVRYYFNQNRALCVGVPAEYWGNYLALETSTDLSAAGQLRGGGRSRRRGANSLTRLTPSLFALVGTQHRGPGHRLLYDLSAGIGLEAPPPYTADATMSRPWDIATQINLRVYFVNKKRTTHR